MSYLVTLVVVVLCVASIWRERLWRKRWGDLKLGFVEAYIIDLDTREWVLAHIRKTARENPVTIRKVTSRMYWRIKLGGGRLR